MTPETETPARAEFETQMQRLEADRQLSPQTLFEWCDDGACPSCGALAVVAADAATHRTTSQPSHGCRNCGEALN